MLLRLSVRGQRLVLRSQNCATQRWRGCSSRHAETSVAVSKPDAVRRAAVVSAQTAFSSLPPLPSPVADAVPVANGAAELPLPEEVEPPLEEAEWLPPSSNTPLARGTLYMVSTPVVRCSASARREVVVADQSFVREIWRTSRCARCACCASRRSSTARTRGCVVSLGKGLLAHGVVANTPPHRSLLTAHV